MRNLEPTRSRAWARRVFPTLLAALLLLPNAGCKKRHRRMRHPTSTAAVAGTSAVSPLGLDRIEWGERLFSDYGCVACHTIHGERLVGPALDHVAGTTRAFTDGTSAVATSEYLRESLISPNAKVVAGYRPEMPSYAEELDEDQVGALVEYLETLR